MKKQKVAKLVSICVISLVMFRIVPWQHVINLVAKQNTISPKLLTKDLSRTFLSREDIYNIKGAKSSNNKHEPIISSNVNTDTKLISMEEYIRDYSYTTNIKVCGRTIRPETPDITWHKEVYQHFKWNVEKHGEQDVFILNHYFDDRFFTSHGVRVLRAPVSIRAPGDKNPQHRSNSVWLRAIKNAEFKVLLWYHGFNHPISVHCAHQPAVGLIRAVNNTYHIQRLMHCTIPEIELIPNYISITNDECSIPQTYTTVVFPNSPRSPGSRDIGICMASLFGAMDKTNIPYFVNWMETLNLFGVIEVSMNNASMQFRDFEIARAFQYYIDKGQLTLTHYPIIHDNRERNPSEDDAATEAINKITTGDCFYRNIKRYWYTLIIDMDEIPVPTRHNTYVEYLENYLAQYPNYTNVASLAIRSAYNTLDMPPGNTEYAQHLPILRYTNRLPVEPIGLHDVVGISKSFHNTQTCVASGHHACRVRHEGDDAGATVHFMPSDDILIHHYRVECKYQNDCDNLTPIHDTILPDKFGQEIKTRVEKVLLDLMYPFNL